MRGRNLFFTGLLIALVGVLLIIFRTALADGGIVTAAGILFVLAGVLNMAVFLAPAHKGEKPRAGVLATTFGWIASAAAAVLGLAMLIFSKVFVAIVGFMFAVLLLFAALFQLFVLLFGARPVRFPGWLYIVPTLLVGAAIYIFMRRPDTPGETIDLILTGSGFILFGAATIIEGLILGNVRRQAANAAREASKAVMEGRHTEQLPAGEGTSADRHATEHPAPGSPHVIESPESGK